MIEITTIENDWKFYFSSLEYVAQWLERRHHRKINIAEEIEPQITDINGCYFYINGKKYYYKQI